MLLANTVNKSGLLDIGAGVWVVFCALVVVAIGIDAYTQRGRTTMTTRGAVILSVVWIAAGLAVGAFIWAGWGAHAGGEYLAGYTIEKMLSIDNLAVMMAIFTAMRVDARHQKRVLTYGIAGAIVFRALFVIVGAGMLHRFAFMNVVFGAVLLVTAVKMARPNSHGDQSEPALVARLSKVLPVVDRFDGDRFITRDNGRMALTLLGVCVIVVELTDVMFAVDSVPAVLAVSPDPFIAFASNVMAVLGLRALYFLMATGVERFRYLNPTLAAVLGFVGAKMALHQWVHVGVGVSLAIVVGLFVTGMVASAIVNRRTDETVPEPAVA